MMCREGTDCEVRFVKDDEEDLPAEVQDGGRDRRGEGREDPLPGRRGVARELLDGADDVFGKTQQEREGKRSEEAARRKCDEALPGGCCRAKGHAICWE